MVTHLTKGALSDDLDRPKVCQLDFSSAQAEVLGFCPGILFDLAFFGIRRHGLHQPCFELNPSESCAFAGERAGIVRAANAMCV